MSQLYPSLFTPVKIGNLELRNRIVMSLYPTKYVKNNEVTDRLIAFFKARAAGGAAMIVLDGACLDYPATLKGSIHLRMDTEEHAAGLRRLLNAVQSAGAKAFMQLDWAGFKIVPAGTPSAKERKGMWVLPVLNEASPAELRGYIDKIAAGAARVREIGYDGVEIQASYGAFISQLLSPLNNKRTDEFGGELENRARFLLEIIGAVKKEAGGDFPVEIKYGVDEHVAGGFSLSEAKTVAKWMEDAGADALMIGSGNKKTKNHLLPPHSLPPGVNVDYAAVIKDQVSIPVMAAGKIGDPGLMEEIIAGGKADMVALTRALIADPDLPEKVRTDRPQDIRGCIFCLDDCADKGAAGIGRACTVNPFAGLEDEFVIEPSKSAKRIWVIGGGPAGMQAAITLDRRGHHVSLFEKGDVLGGHFNLAHLAPKKQEVAEANRFLRHMLESSGVEVVLEREITAAEITSANPDHVFIAAGSWPRRPDIEGVDLNFVHEARAFLSAGAKAGPEVVIIGGGDVGCELADLLADESSVTVVEMMDTVLPKMKSMPREDLLDRLSSKEVRVMTGAKVVRIEPGKVIIAVDGVSRELKADTVIHAVGSAASDMLLKELKGKAAVTAIGDAVTPGNLGDALRSAVRAALTI